MASTPTPLGELQRLPREIRDKIYEYFMHWNTYPGYHAWRFSLQRISESKKRTLNSLALHRTSSVIHAECAHLMYQGWHLTLVLSHKNTILDPKSWSYDRPYIEARASHPAHGTLRMPDFAGPLPASRSTASYAHISHSRWESVIVELHAPEPSCPGTFLTSWRGAILIAAVMQRHRPTCLTIKPVAQYVDAGQTRTESDDEVIKLPVGILRRLLSAFDCIGINAPNSSITLQASQRMGQKLKNVHHAKPSMADIFEMSVAGKLSLDELATNPAKLDTLAQLQYYELCLDYILDSFAVSEASRLREQRFMLWSPNYERTMIEAASMLPEKVRKRFLSALVER